MFITIKIFFFLHGVFTNVCLEFFVSMFISETGSKLSFLTLTFVFLGFKVIWASDNDPGACSSGSLQDTLAKVRAYLWGYLQCCGRRNPGHRTVISCRMKGALNGHLTRRPRKTAMLFLTFCPPLLWLGIFWPNTTGSQRSWPHGCRSPYRSEPQSRQYHAGGWWVGLG